MQSVLPTVLSSHDSVALWRAGRQAVTTAAVRSITALVDHEHELVRNDEVQSRRLAPGSAIAGRETAMPNSSPRVAVIGLGAMGLPMAAHLATTFSVIGFDPFAPRRELAAESG